MSAEFMRILIALTIVSSLAIVAVLFARTLVRRIAGSQVAYWLWLLVPVSTLVLAIPAPSAALEITPANFPDSILSTLSDPMFSGRLVNTADYMTMGLFVWAMGSVSMLALTVYRQTVFIRSLGNLVSAQDGTHRSVSIGGPVLIGIWRPRIVLPTDFETRYSHDERALILAHEHAHRRRGDILVNSIAAVLVCFFWFNPFMYWAIARLRFDQELACDAVVLAGSISKRRCYADALLKTQLAADSAWDLSIGCHWQASHPLKERIAMLKRPLPSFARRLSGAVLTTALIGSSSYAAWVTQPEPARATQSKDESQHLRISADRISTSPGGDLDYSGNVVIEPIDSDGPEMSWNADTVNRTDDGTTVLAGSVRFSFASHVVTTDRATILKDRTIKMDSAHLASTAKTR